MKLLYLFFICQVSKNVIVIITDDDQSEADTINEFLKKRFINAKTVRFSWHIVDLGWESNLRCMIGCTKKLQSIMVSNETNNTVGLMEE